MIEVRNLVKRYGDHLAVDHLSFTVEKGQIYGFLGPNGAGKSTTMNIMTGYIGATSGEVLVDGRSILDEPEQAKRCIGYLPEIPPLYMDMTVVEYLDFCAELKAVPKANREAQVDEIMNRTKLADMSIRLIRNLSKGYRQRVGLAQALLGYPEVIILDEPTVGLDPQQIIEIRALIRELAADHTVILSSHILSEVQETCDNILIIHHGKMIAQGTPEELENQMAGGSNIEILVKGTVQNAKTMLAALTGEGVRSFTAQEGKEAGVTLCKLEKRQGAADLREVLFRACAKADLPILQMSDEKAGLEQIFLSLIAESDSKETVIPSRWKKKEKATPKIVAVEPQANHDESEMISKADLQIEPQTNSPDENQTEEAQTE